MDSSDCIFSKWRLISAQYTPSEISKALIILEHVSVLQYSTWTAATGQQQIHEHYLQEPRGTHSNLDRDWYFGVQTDPL